MSFNQIIDFLLFFFIKFKIKKPKLLLPIKINLTCNFSEVFFILEKCITVLLYSLALNPPLINVPITPGLLGFLQKRWKKMSYFHRTAISNFQPNPTPNQPNGKFPRPNGLRSSRTLFMKNLHTSHHNHNIIHTHTSFYRLSFPHPRKWYHWGKHFGRAESAGAHTHGLV